MAELSEKPSAKERLAVDTDAVVEQWFCDHFCAPAFYQTELYNRLHEAKEDLKGRLREV